MNHHHFRSLSEQPQHAVTIVGQQPNAESFVRIHSDSKQSLDRLFNPPSTAVPLRSRNLPRSFFDPIKRSANGDQTSPNGIGSNNDYNLHQRSISYGSAGLQASGGNVGPNNPRNFHLRTHSGLAPMSTLLASNNSSFHSSQEFLLTDSGVSIVGNGMGQDDPMASTERWVNDGSLMGSNPENLDYLSNSAASRSNFTLNTLHTSGQLGHEQHQAASIEPTVAARSRQQSLYNGDQVMEPLAQNNNGTTFATGHSTAMAHGLHSRSMSFDQRAGQHNGSPNTVGFNNLHIRTHSTLAPIASMQGVNQPAGFSQEFRAYNQAPNGLSSNNDSNSNPINNNSDAVNQSATGWSSSGYSSDDMVSMANGWAGANQQLQQQQPAVQAQATLATATTTETMQFHQSPPMMTQLTSTQAGAAAPAAAVATAVTQQVPTNGHLFYQT